MAKRRIINTKFWSDGYISELDPSEKLLFLYFLTNPYTNICGAYEISIRQVALDTGFDKEMVERILNRFAEDDKVLYQDGYIIIKNFIKHQEVNPKVRLGIESEVKNLPDDIQQIVYDSLSYLNSNLNLNSNPNTKAEPAKVVREKEKKTPFTQFWGAYPYKVDKQRAEILWNKLPLEEQKAVLADIPVRNQSPPWTREGGKYRPMPSTYLKNRRWEDEIQVNVPIVKIPVLSLKKP